MATHPGSTESAGQSTSHHDESTKPIPLPPEQPEFGEFDSYLFTTRALEDEIVLLEDVDFEMVIPTKLSALDFPKAEDGHEEDVAEVIRKSFSKLGMEHQSRQESLAGLAHGALSLHLSWQAQVEASVEQQGDEFWRRVRRLGYVLCRSNAYDVMSTFLLS